MKNTATKAMIAAILLMSSPAAAGDNIHRSQNYRADFTHLSAPVRKPLTTLTLYGRSVDLNASGKYALSQRWNSADDFDHAEAMGKAMPAYPQPPIVMIDARLRF